MTSAMEDGAHAIRRDGGAIQVAHGRLVAAPGVDVVRSLSTPDCHHGCGCRLHDLVVYGPLAGGREADSLDEGELQALFGAARRASEGILAQAPRLDTLRSRLIRAQAKARDAIAALESFTESGEVLEARVTRDERRATVAGYGPDLLHDPPRRVRWGARGVLLAIGVFDAWYFSETFKNLLRISPSVSWLEWHLPYLPALIIPVGLVMIGVLLAGPAWRTVLRWRGSAEEARDSGWRPRLVRAAALLAFPAFLLWVVAIWAQTRAQSAAVPLGGDPPVPKPWTVVALLLALAAVAIVIEMWLGNPFVAAVRDAERDVLGVRKRRHQLQAAASNALTGLEQEWSAVRSCRDTVLMGVRTEVAHTWETLILPARMRHGATGHAPPELLSSAGGEEEARQAVEFFSRVSQPMPGLGPLNELIRLIKDADPQALRQRYDTLVSRLDQDQRTVVLDLRDPAQTPAPASGGEHEQVPRATSHREVEP